jgi:hypothetical protein
MSGHASDAVARAEAWLRFESGADYASCLRGYMESHADPKAALVYLLFLEKEPRIYRARPPGPTVKEWLDTVMAEQRQGQARDE